MPNHSAPDSGGFRDSLLSFFLSNHSEHTEMSSSGESFVAHWSSVELGLNDEDTNLFSCIVSIAADATLLSCASGVRIMIVHDEEIPLQLMLIRRVQHKEGNYLPPRLVNSRKQNLPPVVLEIIAKGADDYDCHIGLVLYKVTPKHNRRMRILYEGDLFFPHDTPMACICLESNWPFVNIPREFMDSLFTIFLASGIPWSRNSRTASFYRVHLSSLTASQLSSPRINGLATPILHRIINILILEDPENWRKHIWNMGAVCKEWSPMLDIFFSSFKSIDRPPCPSYYTGLTASSILRSLQAGRPERALLMKAMSLEFFPQREDTYEDSCFVDLLTRTAAVKELEIKAYSSELNSRLLAALSELKLVESIQFPRTGYFNNDCPQAIDFFPIFTEWPVLRQVSGSMVSDRALRAHFGEKVPYRLQLRPEYDNFPNKFICGLEKLHLSLAVVDGDMLLHALPENGPPRLTELRLECCILGLEATDLRSFLQRAGISLKLVHFDNCTFKSSKIDPPSQNFVIDDVMPYLSELRKIAIFQCDGIVSPASIRTKPSSVPGSRFYYRGQPWGYTDVVESLKTTNWEVVDVSVDHRGDYTEANEVAEMYGIKFRGSY